MNQNQITGIRRAMRASAMRWRRDAKKLSAHTDKSLLHGLEWPTPGHARYWLENAVYYNQKLRGLI